VAAEGGETEDEDEVLDDDDDEEASGARPRRISELKIPNKVKPIPLASSLFVFSPTNRSVAQPPPRSISLIANSHRPTRPLPLALR